MFSLKKKKKSKIKIIVRYRTHVSSKNKNECMTPKISMNDFLYTRTMMITTIFGHSRSNMIKVMLNIAH